MFKNKSLLVNDISMYNVDIYIGYADDLSWWFNLYKYYAQRKYKRSTMVRRAVYKRKLEEQSTERFLVLSPPLGCQRAALMAALDARHRGPSWGTPFGTQATDWKENIIKKSWSANYKQEVGNKNRDFNKASGTLSDRNRHTECKSGN